MLAQERFGTARFARANELKSADLLGKDGLHHGYTFEKKPRRIGFDADTPSIILGSAGSGKLATHIAYQLLAHETTAVLDTKGELAAICAMMMPWAECYCFNPYGLWDDKPWYLPMHSINVLDIIEPHSPTMFEDALTMASNLINKPKGGGGNSEHFHGKAVQIVTCVLVCLREHNPDASLADVYQVIGDIRGGAEVDYFADLHYPAMKVSSFIAVQQMADELFIKREKAPAEFESILSTVSNSLQCLGSPALQRALSSPSAISVQKFCEPDTIKKLFIMMPAHLLEVCAPVIRCLFTAITIQQQRKPLGRIHLLIDEAGQLGHFEAMQRMFSFGRGSKCKVTAVFQNIGQPLQHYGQEGFDTLFGNAQSKLFLGLASEKSAKYVSDYLGKATTLFNPMLKQFTAATRRAALTQKALSDGNLAQALPDILREHEAMNAPDAVSRALMTPDELIHLPSDMGIVSFHGLGVRPFKYQKIPYFQNRDFAHRFLPNPYHAPFDKVALPRKWRLFKKHKTVPIISETAPAELAHLPQYAEGMWSYPKGYAPFKPKRRWRLSWLRFGKRV
ncbi:type IV secretory system conjugative DNA transfer family protein [Alteromonas sp. a30]|uniref:type IV secretory system conjugative DNA transfer family protein n=1 Tax=Alteromonas sp. a30 TaxID=2730917 RepID=UPI00227FFE9A|nr:type IV secretory system conjugative DNA transfer family protein [Alteromonas sp. a30]MCY7297304.1 type IV secretory system conjugative DNA transfer family protein [Alteromonas sp. a30]